MEWFAQKRFQLSKILINNRTTSHLRLVFQVQFSLLLCPMVAHYSSTTTTRLTLAMWTSMVALTGMIAGTKATYIITSSLAFSGTILSKTLMIWSYFTTIFLRRARTLKSHTSCSSAGSKTTLCSTCLEKKFTCLNRPSANSLLLTCLITTLTSMRERLITLFLRKWVRFFLKWDQQVMKMSKLNNNNLKPRKERSKISNCWQTKSLIRLFSRKKR